MRVATSPTPPNAASPLHKKGADYGASFDDVNSKNSGSVCKNVKGCREKREEKKRVSEW